MTVSLAAYFSTIVCTVYRIKHSLYCVSSLPDISTSAINGVDSQDEPEHANDVENFVHDTSNFFVDGVPSKPSPPLPAHAPDPVDEASMPVTTSPTTSSLFWHTPLTSNEELTSLLDDSRAEPTTLSPKETETKSPFNGAAEDDSRELDELILDLSGSSIEDVLTSQSQDKDLNDNHTNEESDIPQNSLLLHLPPLLTLSSSPAAPSSSVSSPPKNINIPDSSADDLQSSAEADSETSSQNSENPALPTGPVAAKTTAQAAIVGTPDPRRFYVFSGTDVGLSNLLRPEHKRTSRVGGVAVQPAPQRGKSASEPRCILPMNDTCVIWCGKFGRTTKMDCTPK